MPTRPAGLPTCRARPLACIAFLALLGVLATACTGTDDPRQGGFFDGIGNLVGGGYDRRIEREQAALGTELTQRSLIQERATALDQTRRQQQQEIRTVKRQIAKLEERLRAARERRPDPAPESGTGGFARAELQLVSLQTSVRRVEQPDRADEDMATDLTALRAEMSDLSNLVASLE